MQLKTIVLAAPALGKLSAGDLELRLAYKLKNLISMLQKDVDFFIEQRQKSLKDTERRKKTEHSRLIMRERKKRRSNLKRFSTWKLKQNIRL